MSVIDTSIQKYPEKCTECPWCGYVHGSNVHIECRRDVRLEWFAVEEMNAIGRMDGCPLRSLDAIADKMGALRKQAADGGDFNAASYVESCIAILKGVDKK